MSMQGTWAGNMITQAVADTLNLKFYIGESDENFMEITLVEPANARANWRLEYIGHKGQTHSVLTCPVISGRSLNGVSNSTNDFNEFENNSNTEYIINTQKIHVDNARYELISYPYNLLQYKWYWVDCNEVLEPSSYYTRCIMLLPYSATRAFVPKTFRTFEQQSSHSSACLFMGDFKRVSL